MNAVISQKEAPKHAPMTQFPVREGELQIGGMPLSRLACRIGQTPFYAYDRGVLKVRMEALRSILPPQVHVHYAMKANPMPAVVQTLAPWVDGVDVASAGELKVALDAGVNPANISFAGPGKRDKELLQAVAAGVLINVESVRELPILAEAAAQCGVVARVAIRVNPDCELKGAGMRMGGGAKPFGIDAENVPHVLTKVAEYGLAFEGFHLFAGSQSLQAQALCDAQTRLFDLACELAKDAPTPVKVLNLGGGFGVPYFPGEQALDVAPIGQHLAGLVAQAATQMPEARITLELGRYLVAEAGIYVAKVVDRKTSRGKTFLVTDGGLHHHLAASGNFGQVLRKNYPVAIGNRMADEATEMVSVVGPLCTPLDLLADNMCLPCATIGDYVVIFQSGAYGASASPQGFLGHPAVVEVLVG